MSTDAPGCGGHAGLAAEVRALATTALDRLEPLLATLLATLLADTAADSSRSDSSRGDSDRGGSDRGDPNRADPNRADPNRADPNRADTGRGDPGGAVRGAWADCPLCAVVALARGERHDLTARLGEHATAALDVLRAVLRDLGTADPAPAPVPDDPPGRGSTREGRRVQRIPVDRGTLSRTRRDDAPGSTEQGARVAGTVRR